MDDPEKTRIFIVDSHPTIRRGLQAQLSRASHLEVAGQVGSAEEALEALEETPVDVVLTDIGLEEMNGLELTRRLKEGQPERAILIVTAYEDYQEAAREAGADGYVLQDRVDGELIDAVEIAARGEMYFRKP